MKHKCESKAADALNFLVLCDWCKQVIISSIILVLVNGLKYANWEGIDFQTHMAAARRLEAHPPVVRCSTI